MNAQPVTIVVDGRLIGSSTPAVLRDGRVYAPVDPFAAAIATETACDPGCRHLTLKLHDRTIRMRVAAGPSGARTLALGRAAAALGESVAFDARTKTLEISSPPAAALTTPAPFVAEPPNGDYRTFTPYGPPTPIPTVSGIPRPRRTPILIEPEPTGER